MKASIKRCFASEAQAKRERHGRVGERLEACFRWGARKGECGVTTDGELGRGKKRKEEISRVQSLLTVEIVDLTLGGVGEDVIGLSQFACRPSPTLSSTREKERIINK